MFLAHPPKGDALALARNDVMWRIDRENRCAMCAYRLCTLLTGWNDPHYLFTY